MKRKLIDRCIDWKDKTSQLPLYITGARGVGKTYLALDFAKEFYQIILYLNFETDPSLNQFLIGAQGEELIQRIYAYSEQNAKASFLTFPFQEKSTLVELEEDEIAVSDEEIVEQSKILILDEISCCMMLPQILSAVIQSKTKIPVILINSHSFQPSCFQKNMFEVVSYHCFPFDFEEFLQATSNEWYIGVINEHFDSNQPVPEIVHKELLELYNIYLNVGGMPEAVAEYLQFGNINCVSEKHRLRYAGFLHDIQGWNGESEALKMRQVIETMPIQLMKKNKKFQYTYIRKGVTKAMYEEAIALLEDSYYVVSSKKKTDDQQIKLYFSDTGMMASLIREKCEKASWFSQSEIREALLENSIAQALSTKEYPLYFWESNSSAKVDFLLGNKNLLPVELFADDQTRSKNLSVLKEKYPFDYAVKISTKNFAYKKHVKYVPPYAVYCL